MTRCAGKCARCMRWEFPVEDSPEQLDLLLLVMMDFMDNQGWSGEVEQLMCWELVAHCVGYGM